jgi:hypothetical protein
MASHKNPYREDSKYAKIFEDLRVDGQKGITRSELLKSHAVADVTVVLSPRDEGVSTRGGDPRGNMSAQGHLYFVDKRKKDGEEARYVLRWRKTPLEKRVRAPKKEIASQKANKSKTSKSKTVEPATVEPATA